MISEQGPLQLVEITYDHGSSFQKLWKCPKCGWHHNHHNDKAPDICANCSHIPTGPGAKARTQKGIGISALQVVYPRHVMKLHGFAQSAKGLKEIPDTAFPCFARPCPATPKHGYIDSRVVKTRAEAARLLKTVLKDDPKGELMLCPFIDADYNVIWTPGSIVVGKGHDGATAGKDTLTFPLAGMIEPNLQKLLASAKIGEGEWPYIEAVISGQDGNVTLTQLRAGPAIGDISGDYIPTVTEVTEIITADPAAYKDREWEVLIENAAGKPGVVVWYPGGAMTSHFAIHAFTHQIPVIFGETPKIGQILEPTTSVKHFDPEAMLRGLVAGEKFPLTKLLNKIPVSHSEHCSGGVDMLLLALHNATALTEEHSAWIGAAAAIMLRLGNCALAGEARHLDISGIKKGQSRDAVYVARLPYSLTRQRAAVNNLVNIHRYGAWHSAAFGGIKWATCGAALVELFESVHQLAKSPSAATAANVVKALNLAVNQAHNGGWWLNKFGKQSSFETIPKGSVVTVLNTVPVLSLIGRIIKKMPDRLVAKTVDRIKRWPETTLAPPRPRSVGLLYREGIQGISIKIDSRLLGNKFRQLDVKISEVLPEIATHTWLVETTDGYQIECRPPGRDPVVLWRDDSLAANAAKVEAAMDKTVKKEA